jgi:hypothetical protein
MKSAITHWVTAANLRSVGFRREASGGDRRQGVRERFKRRHLIVGAGDAECEQDREQEAVSAM